MSVRYVLSRVAQTLLVVWLVSVGSYMFLAKSPGDPLRLQSNPEEGSFLTEQQVQDTRRRLGLDQPVHIQYIQWAARTVSGDWGMSSRTGQPVLVALRERAPVTLMLAGLSATFAIALSVPLGVLAALYRNSWFDRLATVSALAGVAMPNIWFGVLLILFFSVTLGWLPPSGYVPFSESPFGSLQRMILPTIVLGTGEMASLTRQTRSSMLEVLRQDYVRTAQAKGLSQFTVITRHALRNALLPVVTILGLRFGSILSGSVITETIFALPGMGRLAVEGIFLKDYAVTMAFVMMVATLVAVSNLVTDLAYGLLDPRIQLGHAGGEAG
ncbi:MAG: ABC transporter permease [Dehalococcoidia bacterium]|nr:ABC transporter permease [Dehalococcoidia bacterium]